MSPIIKYCEEWFCDTHRIRVPAGEGCELCIDESWPDEEEATREVEFWNNSQPIGGFEYGSNAE